MSTITISTEMASITCGPCGGVYAITERHRSYCQEYAKSWICPYCGTGWGFSSGKTAAQKLQEKLDALEQQTARQLAELRVQRDKAKVDREDALKEAEHFRKSRDGMKGALRKVRNRVTKAVCPCCPQSFPDDQMPKHLQAEHPDFNPKPQHTHERQKQVQE